MRKIRLRAKSPDTANLGIEIEGTLVFEDDELFALKVGNASVGIVATKENYKEVTTDIYGRQNHTTPTLEDYVWRCAMCGDEFTKFENTERLEHAQNKGHYSWLREWRR